MLARGTAHFQIKRKGSSEHNPAKESQDRFTAERTHDYVGRFELRIRVREKQAAFSSGATQKNVERALVADVLARNVPANRGRTQPQNEPPRTV
jgi:hypothetical protein